MTDNLQAAPDTPAAPVDLQTWRPDWDYGPLAQFPLYTRANIGEVLPGIISPLNALAGATALDAGMQIVGKCLGTWEAFAEQVPAAVTRGEELAFVGVFYGRAHLNLSLLSAGADLVPGSSGAAVEEQYLGRVRNPGAPPRKLSLAEQRVRLGAAPRFLRMLARAPRLTREQGRRVEEYLGREAALNRRELSAAALLERLEYSHRFQAPVAALHLFNSAAASAGLETLARTAGAWLPEAPNGYAENLVTGLPDVESARPAYEIWRLSRLVLASPQLSAVFAATPTADLPLEIGRLTNASAARFQAEMRAFLGAFGYRAMREVEISAKSWADDPSFVYATIKSYLQAGEDADPFAAHARQQDVRLGAEAYADKQLGLLRRLAFRRVLRIAQTFIALREQTKAQWVRAMGPSRAVFQEAGRRLAAAGVLADSDDVYMLSFDEFAAALRGSLGAAEASAAAERRRGEMAICERIELPEWFEGVPVPRWAEASVVTARDGAAAEEVVLRGIPVSPGRVRGRARVILELDEEATLEQGEILVAPFTDAAWTPLFFTAAGVVVDLGGPLSHGSTVAREYGLPAVVNVKTGTRAIRNGQEITVDGTRGEVVLHG